MTLVKNNCITAHYVLPYRCLLGIIQFLYEFTKPKNIQISVVGWVWRSSWIPTLSEIKNPCKNGMIPKWNYLRKGTWGKVSQFLRVPLTRTLAILRLVMIFIQICKFLHLRNIFPWNLLPWNPNPIMCFVLINPLRYNSSILTSTNNF